MPIEARRPVSVFAFRDYRSVIRLRNDESVTGYDLSFDPAAGLRFALSQGAPCNLSIPLEAVRLVLFVATGAEAPRVRYGQQVITLRFSDGEELTGRSVTMAFGDGVWIAPDGVTLGLMLAFVPHDVPAGVDVIHDEPAADGGFGADPTGFGLESWLAYTGSAAMEDIWRGDGERAAPPLPTDPAVEPPVAVRPPAPEQPLGVAGGVVPRLGASGKTVGRYPEPVIDPSGERDRTSSGFTDRHELAVDPYEEDTELGFSEDVALDDIDVSVSVRELEF